MKLNPEFRNAFENSEDIRRYVLGGRGVVTLESPSGVSYTYAFRRPLDDEFPKDIIFIYLVSSDRKLFYLGMLEELSFRLTKNSRYLKDTSPVKGAKWIARMMVEPQLVSSTHMKLYHEGVCGRCGRPLTQTSSISSGFGRKCLSIVEACDE